MAMYILISLGTSSQAVDAAVGNKIAKEDLHQMEPGKWLINSNSATSKELSDSLGLSDSATFFVAPLRGYFGRANPNIWEWLAAKATAKSYA